MATRKRRDSRCADISATGSACLQPEAPSGALAVLCITNLTHVERVYGNEAGRDATLLVLRRAEELSLNIWRLIQIGFDRFALTPRTAAPTGGPAAFLEALAAGLAAAPLRCGGAAIHLHLAEITDDFACAGPVDPARYRRDMAVAAEAFDAMADDRLHIVWQAVCPADGAGAPLYHEALARIVDRHGEVRSVADAVAAMERLGLVRAFDRHIVSRVVDELEHDPEALLAVNISALSAAADLWWPGIMARLAARPDVARRLVIEITESAALPAQGAATAFVDRMRGLGCRIALDDFGVGHASVRQLLALAPDIVKIDAFFLRRTAQAAGAGAMLRHMIGLAGAVAPTVVVEGVETAEQSRLAATLRRQLAGQSDACWQQGYFLGRPAATRRQGGLAPILPFMPRRDAVPAEARAR